MIRFASFDLDGTILDADGRLLAGVVEGIARWRDLGVRSHIVTGRPAPAVLAIADVAALFDVCEVSVLVDDAEALLDTRSRRMRSTAHLAEEVVTRIRRECTHYVASADGRLLASTRRAARSHAIAYRLSQAWVRVEPATGPINRITVYDETCPDLTGATIDEIHAFSANVVKPAHSGKAIGVDRHLADPHGSDLTESIAVGDADGDAELLARSAVGVAVAMSSAAATIAASVHLDCPLAEFLATTDPLDLSLLARPMK